MAGPSESPRKRNELSAMVETNGLFPTRELASPLAAVHTWQSQSMNSSGTCTRSKFEMIGKNSDYDTRSLESLKEMSCRRCFLR